MPNHITNIVTIYGEPERISELKESIQNSEFGIGTIDFEKIIPMPESERENWYDWRCAHWGTKWNAYGYKDDIDYPAQDDICFLTAWSVPHPVIKKLAQMYPDVTFNHRWADEDIGSNCGESQYEHGELVAEYFPVSQKEAVEFAANVMHTTPEDYGMELSKDGTGYLYRE